MEQRILGNSSVHRFARFQALGAPSTPQDRGQVLGLRKVVASSDARRMRCACSGTRMTARSFGKVFVCEIRVGIIQSGQAAAKRFSIAWGTRVLPNVVVLAGLR